MSVFDRLNVDAGRKLTSQCSKFGRRGQTRDSRVVVPYFEAAPYMLVNTDLIFTTARHFAEHFAQVIELAIVRLPLAFPPMRFYQLWHDRAQHDPAHIWLRSMLRGASEHLSKARTVREI